RSAMNGALALVSSEVGSGCISIQTVGVEPHPSTGSVGNPLPSLSKHEGGGRRISPTSSSLLTLYGAKPHPFKVFSMVLPRLAGESAMWIPADFRASILSPAPPLPPAMMAPA